MVVTQLGGIFIDGGCVPGPVTEFMLSYHELGPNVGNGSSEMSSNISGLNQGLKCRLLILR